MDIAVSARTDAARTSAERLAAELGLPLVPARSGGARAGRDADDRPAGGVPELLLVVDDAGLALWRPGADAAPVRVDTRPLAGARRGRDDLVRAVLPRGAGSLRVVDATAGLGADGFLLAAAGAEVTMVERSAVVHALLRDALERARADPATAAAAARVALVPGDARHVLRTIRPPPDVVYLDPMYPEPGKRALKNKGMRLFRALVGADPDAADLLAAARATATRRVVVKRPARAPPLASRPSGSIRGRTVRFDLYAPAG